ncbi:DUF4395 domain-containing protein [Nakamurella silvestris]|nr:DUF4395 domain-containing protein [Nakamurella silvestris]
MKTLFKFPNPVNEVAARTVAAGILALCLAVLVFRTPWLLWPLAYGFLARVASGPTLSPWGQFATRVIVPALPFAPRPVPGPPKRFAQGMGAVMSVGALVSYYAWSPIAAWVLVALIAVAATLESVFGICLGCLIFGRLQRWGVIPDSVCEACNAVGPRIAAAAAAQARAAEAAPTAAAGAPGT